MSEIKEEIKVFLMIIICVLYFVSILCMFICKPIEILIANGVMWFVAIGIIIGFVIYEWLNE